MSKPSMKETLSEANSKEVVLNKPIKRGDASIEKITLRSPNAGELRGLKLADLLNLDIDSIIKVVPRISTPPLVEHEIAKMEGKDLVAISTAVVGFFADTEE